MRNRIPMLPTLALVLVVVSSGCSTNADQDIQQANAAAAAATSPTQTAEADVPLLLPMRGHVQVFGNLPGKGDHQDEDLYAVDLKSDDPRVFPTAPGKIVFADWNCQTESGQPPCYGNVVALDHGNGRYSIYTHLADGSFPAVTAADRVFVNYTTPIGTMGETGCEGCGVHLHFAVRSGPPGLTGRDALFHPGLASENVWGVIAGLPDPPAHATIDRINATTPPGGVWVSPADDKQVVTGRSVTLKARAYPAKRTDPAVAYVNFTVAWPGAGGHWRLACPPVARATEGDRYECNADLVALGAPAGELTVSFDVYDLSGISRLAPHGTHRIRWDPGEVLGAIIAAPNPDPIPPMSDTDVAAPVADAAEVAVCSLDDPIVEWLGPIDELVVHEQLAGGGLFGSPFTFPEHVLDLVEQTLAGSQTADGVLPALIEYVPVLNEATGQAEPVVHLVGVDPARLDALGGLRDPDGNAIDLAALAPDEVAISQETATRLGVATGDSLVVFYDNQRFSVTVAAVAESSFLGGQVDRDVPGIVLPLSRLQQITGLVDHLSLIAVSNTGGVCDGLQLTDAVVTALEGALAGQQLSVVAVKRESYSADVPMFRGNPARAGEMPGPGPKGQPSLRWRFQTGDHIYSSPAVVDGTVYVGSDDHFLYAVDAVTGAQRWRFETQGPVASSPAVAFGLVYVGSEDGILYAVDAPTGAERWRLVTGGPIRSSPAVVDGVVYVGGHDRVLYALDATTGAEAWRFHTDYPMYASPAVADGTVFAADKSEPLYESTVYAVDAATGTERWRYRTDQQIRATPAVAGGVVYAHGAYALLDAATGRLLATSEASVFASPAVADGLVFIQSYPGVLYGLDAATGSERWRVEIGSWNAESSPTVAQGVVYTGCDEALCAIDGASGRELWRYPMADDIVYGGPAVADGVIYATSLNGFLYAIGTPSPPHDR